MKTCSIFCRSYEKDFQWLAYMLRSIQKFATGFCEIIVAVPEGQERKLSHLTVETVITVHDGQPGYLAQQESKLNADLHTQADYIVTIDSDTIFTRPVTPQTFMRDGKPIWMMTPWDAMKGGDEKKAWMHTMVKAIQECPTHEFMRKCTPMLPRWAYGKFREFMQATHKVTLTEYIMSQPKHEFSEWNSIGFFLYLHHRESFFWWDTTVLGLPEKWENQRWSWGGLTPEIRAEIEAALA